MKPRYLMLDNLDDRREIVVLLRKLAPQDRIAWLEACCRAATLPNSTTHPRVQQKTRELAETARWDSSADDRLTIEAYMDVFYICNQYSFDIERALAMLVRMVRRKAAVAT